jgi:single-stranded DNA-binding protein
MTEYPEIAGQKEYTTSAEAADKLNKSGRSHILRARIAQYFWEGNEGSPDQVAEAMGESILAVRPRVSELHVSGFIERTGKRHTNESGMSANIYRLATAEEQFEILSDALAPPQGEEH